MYSLNYKVTTSTCDADGRLKLFAALQMMQDCSEMWIVSEPTVQRYFEEQHRAQLLAARGVEIVRVPRFKEDLTVTTSVYEVMPKFGFRNTFIYDAQGLPCYKSWSMGAFIDRETATLKSIDQTVIDSLTIEPRLEMDYRERRIILPKDGGTAFEPVRVMRADIDYNRHMNNPNYIRIAMELLPEEFNIRALRCEFRIAAKLGDLLTPVVYRVPDGFIVALVLPQGPSATVHFIN